MSRDDGAIPPLRLRALGRLELEVDDGDADRLLAQPRRLALFLYLALRRPGGFVGRDHLLGLFWPDAHDAQARASLRQALRFLRQCLGSEALLGRGDEIGVPSALVFSDVRAFRRALDGGNREEALDLYVGDLLPGFFMPDAPEAQRWLERERRALRSEARDTALALSEAVGSAPDAAVAYARRALAIEPTHEPAARQLVRALDAAGDRAGAVSAYNAFAETLRTRLDLEPSQETRALVGRVRDGAADAADAEPVTTAPAARPDRVVVRPFENLTGDPALELVGRMVVDWVSRGLSEIRGLEVAPPDVTAAGGTDGPDGTERPGAGTMVDGRYYRENSYIVIHARLTDVVNDRLLPGPEPVVLPADSALDGLDELTSRIAAALAPAVNPRATHVHLGARPPTFAAYRAYMEGLEAFISGDWDRASTALARCADTAPTYALPRIVAAIARWNLGELDAAAGIAGEAAALRDTVGLFERAALDMVLAWLKGDWSAAYDASHVQAGLAPGSIAACQVAEEARRLNRLTEARRVLETLDPNAGELRGWLPYWLELTAVLHLAGDHAAELAAAERARRAHPDDPMARWLEASALVGLGRIDEVERRVDELLSLPGDREPRPGPWLLELSRDLRAHGARDAAVTTLARAIAWYEEHVELENGADPRILRDAGRAYYDDGRWDAAARIFRYLVEHGTPGAVPTTGGHHGHLRGHLDEGFLAAIASRRAERDEAARWRGVIESMDRRFLYGADRLWLGKLAMLEGDESKAVSEIRRALSEGLPFGRHLHADPDLEPLRENPRFRALMRPR